MKLYIVRHVETQENAKGLMQGNIPGRVSNLGQLQGALLGRKLREVALDAVYCSPLQRTRDTAAYIMHHHDCPIYYDDDLVERMYGIFEGRPKEEYLTYIYHYKYKNPEILDIDIPIPGGESPRQAQVRIQRSVHKIAKQHQGETVLLITHGSVKWLLMMSYLSTKDLDYKKEYIKFRNCSVSIVFHNSGEIEALNEASYLDKLEESIKN